MAETKIDSHLVLPAGPNLSVQFNDNGKISGDSSLTFDTTNDMLYVGASVKLSSAAPIAADFGGPIKIADGTEYNKFVLTSDSNGLASWQDCAQSFDRILVSLSGDVVTAGGFVIYSSL